LSGGFRIFKKKGMGKKEPWERQKQNAWENVNKDYARGCGG